MSVVVEIMHLPEALRGIPPAGAGARDASRRPPLGRGLQGSTGALGRKAGPPGQWPRPGAVRLPGNRKAGLKGGEVLF